MLTVRLLIALPARDIHVSKTQHFIEQGLDHLQQSWRDIILSLDTNFLLSE